jgi:MoaA/NifB/PqqE/SkfB family radical SAM enzyme
MIPNKNTFCIAPYQHVDITSKGDLRICCTSAEKKRNYKYNELKKHWQSNSLQKLRENLFNGVKDPICNWCWKEEKAGKISHRQVYNKYVGKLIHTHWDKNFIKNTNLQEIIAHPNTKNITSFDLKLGNLCNLKCIMCSPALSSKILAEAQLHPELKEFYKEEKAKDFEWAESQDFKDWCEKNLPQSLYIKFTGGEPFINPYLLETLESIPDEQKQKCILQFTTNLTVVNYKILDTLKKFKETWFDVSVEGIDEVLESARYGHKWIDLEKNLDTLINYSSNNVFVSINHVVQAPTFIGIPKLVNYFDEKQIKIEPLFLNNPLCFQLLSLKTNIKKQMIENFENYKGFNVSYVNALTKFIEQNIEYDENLAKQCIYRLKSFDKTRKNHFTEIIPIDYFI